MPISDVYFPSEVFAPSCQGDVRVFIAMQPGNASDLRLHAG
jgi:hypothetical protein